jgi:hypothetical protein
MQSLEPPPKTALGFVSRLGGDTGEGASIDAEDPRWQLALRISASGSLGRSELLSDFLLYIVDRRIRGRIDEITEPRIGVSVFGRAIGYDPTDDNIVRSYARKLRRRIEEYFTTEGRDETLRLEIPRGGYTPIFYEHVSDQRDPGYPDVLLRETAPNEVGDELAVALKPIESSTPVAFTLWAAIRRSIRPGILLALFLGALLGTGVTLLVSEKLFLPAEEAEEHLLWKQLFSKDRDTLIVPSDDGLVVMQRIIERPVPLTSYVNGTYRTALKTDKLSDVSELVKLGHRRFTSVVDLDFSTRLAQLREVVPERMMIRYARDLRIDDLRTGNAILMGSDESNPWVELFRPQLHFCFQFDSDPDKPSGFANLYPRSGEASIYTTKGQEDRTYGIIAYLPNLTGSGHVLIVAGLNTAGTQAAAAFLLDPKSMAPILQRARTGYGDPQPFELLVGASNVATNASTPHIVLERIGLPQAH